MCGLSPPGVTLVFRIIVPKNKGQRLAPVIVVVANDNTTILYSLNYRAPATDAATDIIGIPICIRIVV